MVLREIAIAAILFGALAELPRGRGGPDMLREFMMQGQHITPYPFKPFPASYVKKALNDGVDWTKDTRGVVQSVKDQGPHGYCGTFGRIQTAEGQYALHSGQPSRSLSEEQMIECVGWTNDQMPSILGLAGSASPGLMAYEDYPYDISKYPETNPPISGHPCKYDKSKVVPSYSKQITNMTGVKGRGASEEQFAAFIHHNGPCSLGVNADVFGQHDGDWFVQPDGCKKVSTGIDHSVVAVGFGTDPDKGPYWLIKNSWGKTWGDHGFIKIARGINCGGINTVFDYMPTYGDPEKYYVDEDVIV